MLLPNDVKYLINKLENAGYEAYAVGGCVRDALLGKEPNDWDITTSARPECMQEVFRGCRVIETGLKHGTLTVMLNGTGYEITTYRKDGDYSDHRRPDSVEFVSDLTQDLERRDFTVNAMATRDGINIIDLFGGRDDLDRHIIRCVGKAEKRFDEDALRILRAVRFASAYDFDIDPATAKAAYDLRDTLSNVSPERIFVELKKLLCGKGVERILLNHPDIIFTIFPELKVLKGFAQNNPWHSYDVWTHTVKAVAAAPQDPVYRIAMLFHDSGKPLCHSTDEKGIDHFYGHALKSHDIVKTALMRMKPDMALYKKVLMLVLEHELRIPAARLSVRKQLVRLGVSNFTALFPVWRADACGQNPAKLSESLASVAAIESITNELINENACISLGQLAVNGNDLAELGIKGKQTGTVLKTLLDLVAAERIANEKQALLDMAQRLSKEA